MLGRSTGRSPRDHMHLLARFEEGRAEDLRRVSGAIALPEQDDSRPLERRIDLDSLGDFDFGIGFENATSYPAPGQVFFIPVGTVRQRSCSPTAPAAFASKMSQLAGNHFSTIVEGMRVWPLSAPCASGRRAGQSSSTCLAQVRCEHKVQGAVQGAIMHAFPMPHRRGRNSAVKRRPYGSAESGRCAFRAGSGWVLFGSRVGVAAQDATPAGEPIKVGFVYVGPIGDLGWTYAHDQGRLALEEAIPNVETGYRRSIPENRLT